MYSKRSEKIRIEFTNIRLISLINLINLISLIIFISLIILTRLAILASQTSNNNDILDRLIKIQISKINFIYLKICLEDSVSSLDFCLRSININLIIFFVLNVIIQIIMLIIMLTHLTQIK